ncbi:MAG TPA: HNH endonuclease signature motif containing protein [Anaeromyxobacteraceae bacterium]|nr:HNH endonuclease signature motif containing protein [Anaeromyxobacteraceae bacterium]
MPAIVRGVDPDQAREILDLGERAAIDLAKLGDQLTTRPLLKAAMETGRVHLRAAQTVARVAAGEAEAVWVERAARDTVRELAAQVRQGGGAPEDVEEDWLRLRAHLPPDERAVVDDALRCAARELPGSTSIDQWEALAQEWLGGFATDAGDDDERRPLGSAFRLLGPGEDERRARLESETERWRDLATAPPCSAPHVRFDDRDSADEVDAKLRRLAKLRTQLDDVIGYCAHAIRRTGLHLRLGFGSFRHYVEERLGLPPRAVEQRERLEDELWASPALREAKRQRVRYEKLRLLATLPEKEIAGWIARAKALTCIALRRRLEGEKERQTRASQRIGVALPRRVAVLLAAAVESVRGLFGRLLPVGTSLAILAAHFFDTWGHVLRRRKTLSQRIRERDVWCLVPGCSRPMDDAHHLELRSRGGPNDEWNLAADCKFPPPRHPRRPPRRGRPGAGRDHVAAEGEALHRDGAGLTVRRTHGETALTCSDRRWRNAPREEISRPCPSIRMRSMRPSPSSDATRCAPGRATR